MEIQKIKGLKIPNEPVILVLVNDEIVIDLFHNEELGTLVGNYCNEQGKKIEELLETPTHEENIMLIEKTLKVWNKIFYDWDKNKGKEIIKSIELRLENMTVSSDTAIKNLKVFSEIKTCLESGYLNLALKLIENLEANNRQGFVGTSFENDLECCEEVKKQIKEHYLRPNKIKEDLQNCSKIT